MFTSRLPIRGAIRAARAYSTQKSNTPAAQKCDNNDLPSHCDVAIIGGGAVGSSIAYWLKRRAGEDLKVVVIEKDRCVSN